MVLLLSLLLSPLLQQIRGLQLNLSCLWSINYFGKGKKKNKISFLPEGCSTLVEEAKFKTVEVTGTVILNTDKDLGNYRMQWLGSPSGLSWAEARESRCPGIHGIVLHQGGIVLCPNKPFKSVKYSLRIIWA